MHRHPRPSGGLERRRLTRAVAIAAALIVAFSATLAKSSEADWERTLTEVRDTFPDVPQMTTEQLADKLAGHEPILLLDARTAAEFRTSHLQGAVRATTVGTALGAIKADGRPLTVVVYCSVGLRSSRLASRLLARGVEGVFNLEGSVFRWANEGRPLVRGTETATTVHPYDDEWGALLKESVRAD